MMRYTSMCNMPVHGKIHGDEGVMGETVWRTRLTNAKNSVLYCHGPSLALVALSLFSLGWLWGYGLAESSRTLRVSRLSSMSAPLLPPAPLSWRNERRTRKNGSEKLNGTIGEIAHTNH